MGTTGSTDREKNPATHAAPLAVKERKIVVLGCAKVGKTALTQQLVQDKFVPEYSPTIDQSHYKTIKLRGGEYLLEIVDTAGQDDTSLFQPLYTIGTHGYVIVYAIDDPMSFEMAQTLREKIQDSGVVEAVVVLVANKTDLDARQVSHAEAQALAESWSCPFLECSATRKESVQRVFTTMLEQILQHEDAPFSS
eukprot:CAMPEP_0174289648 /NCGR_PEP_ID=MMETSP0809-20121228/25796_1 /TAXON_ID=73025 ORGANISM="Eutreptiella gymnastica-like, Strain CCMP1594" /NCGR_SAMPLE_ID=MMETSP0809 /ASSEMBLY_ACC=CAM_ASM_000658 /LENGTH=193 /DNA_ID=CAMNT_0015387719 /DNA_START=70 /DNA_END=648 /DNA_ORIENTATION=+